jgi:hypothetical protein
MISGIEVEGMCLDLIRGYISVLGVIVKTTINVRQNSGCPTLIQTQHFQNKRQPTFSINIISTPLSLLLLLLLLPILPPPLSSLLSLSSSSSLLRVLSSFHYPYQHLGVFFDSKLYFHAHVNFIFSDWIKLLGLIRPITFRFSSLNCLYILHNTLVR